MNILQKVRASKMEYSELLKQKIQSFEHTISSYDTSTTGCPVYVEVTLDKTPSKRKWGH